MGDGGDGDSGGGGDDRRGGGEKLGQAGSVLSTFKLPREDKAAGSDPHSPLSRTPR